MSGTVLVVDDSLTVRMDLLEALEGEGFRVVACGSVAEARLALARERFALAVLDVLLPDGDGVDLLAEIRALPGSPPVLMLSSEAEVAHRIRGLKTGADDYVGKPYDRGHLLSRAWALARRQEPDAGAIATVLVVDDSATYRASLTEALERAGYRVVSAEDGERGLRAAASPRPAAIIVDGVMPGIDGPTMIRQVRLDAALRTIPCILLTASSDVGEELRALDAGADAFVRKSDDVGLVLARLAALLRGTDGPSDDAATLLAPKRILAVDDSPTYLGHVGDVLTAEGYDVVLARSGDEALALLGVQSVDCILLDLIMPGLSGKETCERIKATPGVREVPLILVTSLDEKDAMVEGLATGADDYITKSGDFAVLKARVRAQLRRRQVDDERRRAREALLRAELETREARAARELAEARAALVDQLERKNDELEAFTSAVTHDLRAPLRSVRGFATALREDAGASLDAACVDHVDRILAATTRMGQLVDDLLELSRVDRTALHRLHVDMSALAKQIVAELEQRDGGARTELVVEERLAVDADPGLVRVLLENLLGNAWKFTRRTPAPRIEVGRHGDVFFVRDNGAGFDPAHVDRLFRPFQRLHQAAEFPGTGVGLATAQRVAVRHGGWIAADARPGAGATFTFALGTTT